MKYERMDGLLWARLIIASSSYLEVRKSIVDSLNVFPVPDGDTGTNMSLTMASATRAVMQKEEAHLGLAAKTISYGALMGARGNSGVILSQLFAGFAKYTGNLEDVDAKGFAKALANAVETAYQAVMNPVEGTILTVSKEAAAAAKNEADKPDSTIDSVLEAAYQSAMAALEKTPSMLPVLKQAGVVDAGGQGLVYILEGMLKVLWGEEFEIVPVERLDAQTSEIDRDFFTDGGVLKYQYCTEFILKKKTDDLKLDAIRAFLLDKGDCILVVGSAEASKIHVHTNRPGLVLDYCSDMGSLHEMQIHNMNEQSQEMQMKAKATKHLGIVSVAVGAGLIEIFKSLGVDTVIVGGQTMNPSTQDFLEAIDSILAEEILLLPNNKNIILAAQQAANVSTKPCMVVETTSIPQGIAALMAFNPENEMAFNKQKMEEAGHQIVTMVVTYAVRDSQFDGHNIEKGQILGLVDGKLVVLGENVAGVVEELAAGNIKPDYELVTIYYGEETGEDEARELVERLASKYPDIDFELHFGGQPLYYYLLSLE